MAENSKIEWTDHTFNPWIGCTRVSPGCVHCYAETLMDQRYGRVEWGPKGNRVRTAEAYWRKPLQWNRQAEQQGRRFRVFCASLADVFDEHPSILPEWRADLWALIEATPNLDWQLLTKRPENVLGLIPREWSKILPRNVWVGTSVEDQKRFDERIRALIDIPAHTIFLSYEPALGPIDMLGLRDAFGHRLLEYVEWVIVGGESGQGARPFDIEWARSIIAQGREAEAAVFVKQLGAKPFCSPDHDDGTGYELKLRDGKGGDWSEWPEDLRVREFPVSPATMVPA